MIRIDIHKFRRTLPAGLSDASRLMVLSVVAEADRSTSEAAAERRKFLADCERLAEDVDGVPTIAVVWSGMDCDCSAYRNVVRLVQGGAKEVDEHIKHTMKWSDGPCDFVLAAPSAVAGLRESHRDLAAEAHEDGHPHLVVWPGRER